MEENDNDNAHAAEAEAVADAANAAAKVDEDDTTMKLTGEERQWALDIKRAIEEDPELDNLSDFTYAQLALVDHQNVEAAVERAHRLQAFRNEYDIQDSPQQGQRFMERASELLPGFYLNLGYHKVHGISTCTLVADLSKCYLASSTSNADARNFLQAAYYTYHALNPNLEQIRQGCTFLMECDNFAWKTNYGLQFFQRYWTEIGSVYPLRYFQVNIL